VVVVVIASSVGGYVRRDRFWLGSMCRARGRAWEASGRRCVGGMLLVCRVEGWQALEGGRAASVVRGRSSGGRNAGAATGGGGDGRGRHLYQRSCGSAKLGCGLKLRLRAARGTKPGAVRLLLIDSVERAPEREHEHG